MALSVVIILTFITIVFILGSGSCSSPACGRSSSSGTRLNCQHCGSCAAASGPSHEKTENKIVTDSKTIKELCTEFIYIFFNNKLYIDLHMHWLTRAVLIATYRASAVHVEHSKVCNLSESRGIAWCMIATMQMQNRPTDVEAEGSGAVQ
jgi:hypothetical protein